MAHESSGLVRKRWLRTIKKYVERKGEDEIIKELDLIKDWNLLRLMWSACPRGKIYNYILERIEKEFG